MEVKGEALWSLTTCVVHNAFVVPVYADDVNVLITNRRDIQQTAGRP